MEVTSTSIPDPFVEQREFDFVALVDGNSSSVEEEALMGVENLFVQEREVASVALLVGNPYALEEEALVGAAA